jgi:hypothetical protein
MKYTKLLYESLLGNYVALSMGLLGLDWSKHALMNSIEHLWDFQFLQTPTLRIPNFVDCIDPKNTITLTISNNDDDFQTQECKIQLFTQSKFNKFDKNNTLFPQLHS